jgi:hypothetical protein
MTFTALTEVEEKELHRLQRLYWHEALRCEEAKAYLAGCVMLGSALETILILMVNCHSDDATRTGKVPTVKGNPKPLLDWKYIELLRVAEAANWLPSTLEVDNDEWSSRKGMVGDYAEVVRLVRNFVHPASYVESHSRSRVTAKYLQRLFEFVLLCRDWLADRNSKVLLEHMKSEGIS